MSALQDQSSAGSAPKVLLPAQRHLVASRGWWAADPLLAAILAGLAGMIYWRTFAELIGVWNTDPNYSHGFLVPLCSLVFVAAAWRRHGSPLRYETSDITDRSHSLLPLGESKKSVWSGAMKIVAGVAMHGLAVLAANLLLDVISLVFVLRGTWLLVGGRRANAAFGFAALFLVFMAPLPTAWYQPVALGLQQVVSAISAETLELFGAAVHREGYRIFMPGYVLNVGEACSGIRGLFSILALAVAVGHFTVGSARSRWTLAVLAIPIAVLTNCLRVILTGVIMMLFGARWAEGVLHSLEGMAMLALSAVIVLLVAKWLSRVEERSPTPCSDRTAAGKAAEDKSRNPEPASVEPVHVVRVPGRRLAVASLLLFSGLSGSEVWIRYLTAAGPMSAISLAEPLSNLPMTLGAWQGNDEPITDPNLRYADEHLKRTYRNAATGQAVSVWAVYSKQGADRSHHPEVCMKVAGQSEDVRSRQDVEVEGHQAPVRQYRFGRPGQRLLVFYWHYTLPPSGDAPSSFLQRAYQATHYRRASVTVEVFTPEQARDDAESAQQFVRLLDAAIQSPVGPDAVRRSDTQPIDG